eukprot:TRINITY_DN2756_c0_g1_i2.p1 TRINITY_DN2756_c0_g1~~TRINITY_DN2756_c0_g1_i2.p1  ORF type:complete len:221 (+),score=38.24 TRINITY_DN2756_c0_g1_i2:89-664(+)
MMKVLRTMAFEIIYACMVDTKPLPQEEITKVMGLYEAWVGGLESLPINIPYLGLSNALSARKKLQDHIKELITKSQEKKTQSDFPTVIDVLMDKKVEIENKGGIDGYILTEEDVVDNLIIFLIAGHETVLSAMASLLKNISENPESSTKLQEELKSKLKPDESWGTSTFPFDYSQIASAEYSMACCPRTLR